MKLRAPYQTRSIRFQHIADFQGWRIKVYQITRQAHALGLGSVLEQVVGPVVRHLPLPAVTDLLHGVGFFVVHQGEHRNWLLLDWWYDQEILKQRLFSSPLDEPESITEAEPDLMACTWEMAVHCFERRAWLEAVLQNPAGPDLDAYLEQRLNADV